MANQDIPRKAIVVEDEVSIAIICRRVLESEGFQVQIANDGTIARSLMEQHEYDLYLFDIRLPGMNGQDLYNWLVQARPAEGTAIVFMTGDLLTRDTEEFLRRTGHIFLPKPFSPAQLLDLIRRLFAAERPEAP